MANLKNDLELVAHLLREVANQLSSLDSGSIELLQKGVACLEIVVKPKDRMTNRKRQNVALVDMQRHIDALYRLDSRDQGIAYLQTNVSQAKELRSLAKELDLHILRSDKIANIIDKIVEATIGFRARSAAIRGESTKKDRGDNESK